MTERDRSAEIESLDQTTPAWRTEVMPTNESYEYFPAICDLTDLISKVVSFIISLFGLTGNAAVLWLLGFHMHRNAASVYILNLAATDFLFLWCHIAAFMLNVNSIFHDHSVSIQGLIWHGAATCYITGLSMLCTISMERCLSVLWPIWYRCHRPRHTSAVMCALIWALSMLLGILDWLYCLPVIINTNIDWCRKIDFIITAWLIFLFVILSGSSLALLIRILCGSWQMLLTKLYVTILITVLVFLLCGLPLGIYWFLLHWIEIDLDVDKCLYRVSVFLSCVNSCSNPIIYFFVGSFRQRLKQENLKLVLQQALQDTPEEVECGGSLPQGILETSGSSVRSLCPGPSNVSLDTSLDTLPHHT